MRDRSAQLTTADIPTLDWEKMGGLIPVVVQDDHSGEVLMVAYMNSDALAATLESGFATFFSRSKQRLWEKGETSGNRLSVRGIFIDCDGDALLMLAKPAGPVCHLGSQSCFEAPAPPLAWFGELSRIVAERARSGEPASYTRKLLNEGTNRIAQKIGEEGVELALAAVSRDDAGCVEETADLIYHVSVLMEARGFGWDQVIARLRERHAASSR